MTGRRNNKSLNVRAFWLALVFCLLWSPQLMAGFTETLPMSTFLIDEAFTISWVDKRWDNNGDGAALVDSVERFEPGGGRQGEIIPEPKATYMVLINRLQYGILDDLTFGIGIPVVIATDVDPNIKWETGDYQRQIGRSYSEDDFWAWAESMGQPRIDSWSGNKGELSDIVLGLRFRWTHRIPVFKEIGLQSALSVLGVIPTGKHADPEELVAVGTTMWDLNFQGDLAFHLSFDKSFEEELDGRLQIGLDLFYETFFDRELTSATGEKNPLMRNFAPYIGENYTVNPGDFSGFGVMIDTVPYKGPAWATWLVGHDPEKAKALPPILTLSVGYTFVHLQQSDWSSEFPLWDYDQEELWKPGYKNILSAQVMVSFLRLGVPLRVYVQHRSLSLIPGKNARAPEVLTTGIQIPLKFW